MTVIREKGVPVLAAMALVAGTLAMTSPASAQVQERSEEESWPDRSLADDDHIIVEAFTRRGDLISTEAFARDGAPIPVPEDFKGTGVLFAGASAGEASLQSDRGSGRSPAANGCTTVTVRNENESALGLTAYWFNTWTSWCWNRSSRTISDAKTGFFLEDVDGFYSWRGRLDDETHFYTWQPGYSKSGYRNEKQAPIDNCLPLVGCLGNDHPRNVLSSHSDGTWVWQTFD